MGTPVFSHRSAYVVTPNLGVGLRSCLEGEEDDLRGVKPPSGSRAPGVFKAQGSGGCGQQSTGALRSPEGRARDPGRGELSSGGAVPSAVNQLLGAHSTLLDHSAPSTVNGGRTRCGAGAGVTGGGPLGGWKGSRNAAIRCPVPKVGTGGPFVFKVSGARGHAHEGRLCWPSALS